MAELAVRIRDMLQAQEYSVDFDELVALLKLLKTPPPETTTGPLPSSSSSSSDEAGGSNSGWSSSEWSDPVAVFVALHGHLTVLNILARYKESSASSRKQMDRAGLEAGLHCLLLAWDKVSSSITDVKMILLNRWCRPVWELMELLIDDAMEIMRRSLGLGAALQQQQQPPPPGGATAAMGGEGSSRAGGMTTAAVSGAMATMAAQTSRRQTNVMANTSNSNHSNGKQQPPQQPSSPSGGSGAGMNSALSAALMGLRLLVLMNTRYRVQEVLGPLGLPVSGPGSKDTDELSSADNILQRLVKEKLTRATTTQEVYLRLMALTAMALLSSQQHTHQSKDPATTSKPSSSSDLMTLRLAATTLATFPLIQTSLEQGSLHQHSAIAELYVLSGGVAQFARGLEHLMRQHQQQQLHQAQGGIVSKTPRGPAWDSAADLLVGLAKLLPLDISQDMCLYVTVHPSIVGQVDQSELRTVRAVLTFASLLNTAEAGRDGAWTVSTVRVVKYGMACLHDVAVKTQGKFEEELLDCEAIAAIAKTIRLIHEQWSVNVSGEVGRQDRQGRLLSILKDALDILDTMADDEDVGEQVQRQLLAEPGAVEALVLGVRMTPIMGQEDKARKMVVGSSIGVLASLLRTERNLPPSQQASRSVVEALQRPPANGGATVLTAVLKTLWSESQGGLHLTVDEAPAMLALGDLLANLGEEKGLSWLVQSVMSAGLLALGHQRFDKLASTPGLLPQHRLQECQAISARLARLMELQHHKQPEAVLATIRSQLPPPYRKKQDKAAKRRRDGADPTKCVRDMSELVKPTVVRTALTEEGEGGDFLATQGPNSTTTSGDKAEGGMVSGGTMLQTGPGSAVILPQDMETRRNGGPGEGAGEGAGQDGGKTGGGRGNGGAPVNRRRSVIKGAAPKKAGEDGGGGRREDEGQGAGAQGSKAGGAGPDKRSRRASTAVGGGHRPASALGSGGKRNSKTAQEEAGKAGAEGEGQQQQQGGRRRRSSAEGSEPLDLGFGPGRRR